MDKADAEDETVFYTEERWRNWLDRIAAEEVDPEDEESARLLLNLQDDAAIAVAKVLSAFEDDRIGSERAADGVQTSLVPVFYAAEEYVADGVAEAASVAEYIRAAADAEADEDVDAALGYVIQAGTRIIDGDEVAAELGDEIEYGLVLEWVNGLDSLQSALRGPEEIKPEDDE
jgi:hypothetical protein